MEQFLKKHQDKITGIISVFDRVILKGYLPISYPEGAEGFFYQQGLLLKEFKSVTTKHTEELKTHAMQIAKKAGRPYEYKSERVRKEEYVRGIAARDKVTDGLICVLAVNEQNHSFSLRYGKDRPHLKHCSPRCPTWIKMYNKNGIVLRIETVINHPEEFRVFKIGRGKKAGYCEPLRKRVTNMAHYARLSLRSNSAYLNALTEVDDPVSSYRELDKICEPAKKGNVRYRPMNPLQENDRVLFEAVFRGEHHLHGFKSCDIGKQLGIVYTGDPSNRKQQCARVNRKLRLLRAHGLIVRCGRSRRYRVTEMGIKHMNAAIALHSVDLPRLLKAA